MGNRIKSIKEMRYFLYGRIKDTIRHKSYSLIKNIFEKIEPKTKYDYLCWRFETPPNLTLTYNQVIFIRTYIAWLKEDIKRKIGIAETIRFFYYDKKLSNELSLVVIEAFLEL